MTETPQPPQESGSIADARSAKLGSERRLYEGPRLIEWGSIIELTKGRSAGTRDGNFSGSGGV
jgi:hypothetical protein